MKRFVLLAACCLMAAMLTACNQGDPRESSEKALKDFLSEYYGMKEGSYTAEVYAEHEEEGRNNAKGVIWKITVGESGFFVYMHGEERSRYNDAEVLSNRYSDEFLDYVNREAERKIKETDIFQELECRVVSRYQSEYFRAYHNLIPVSATPENFASFLETIDISRETIGLKMEVRFFSEKPFPLTEEQVKKLTVGLPVNEMLVCRISGTPDMPEEDIAASDKADYLYFYMNGKWEYDEIVKEKVE